jgi:hypothetical protein
MITLHAVLKTGLNLRLTLHTARHSCLIAICVYLNNLTATVPPGTSKDYCQLNCSNMSWRFLTTSNLIFIFYNVHKNRK